MTNEVVAELEAVEAKVKSMFSPAAQADIKSAENAAHAIEHKAVSYIETNGLHDLYQIALTVVGAMVPGASWTAALTSIESQAVAAGKQIVQGSVAIVASQAQADLIAAGMLLPPVASAA